MGAKSFTSADKQLRPDPRYGDRVLSRFINSVMRDGQKNSAQRCVYGALEEIRKRMEKNPHPAGLQNELEVFQRAIENVKPHIEVRSKRVGGANYQVPMPVGPTRRQSLAFRWIIDSCRAERGRPMAMRLAEELFNASKGEGKAMSTRDQVHRMAEANRAFAHFAW